VIFLALALTLALAAACSDDAKKATGEDCSTDTDCADKACHAGICVASNPLANGQACDNDGYCKSLDCSGGTCAPGTAAAGETCLNDEECASTSCQGNTCSGGGADAGVDSAPPQPDAGVDVQVDAAVPFACYQTPGGAPAGTTSSWGTMPIQYKINASEAATEKATWIAELQKAFQTWGAIPCTDLSFNYAGETTGTGKETGYLTVVVRTQSFPYGKLLASTTKTHDTSYSFVYADLELNAKDHQWSAGAEASKYDIQTTVSKVIPEVLGFRVKGDSYEQNKVETTLASEYEQGAQYLYYKAGCGSSKPTIPSCY
jgi:hypothetical protein